MVLSNIAFIIFISSFGFGKSNPYDSIALIRVSDTFLYPFSFGCPSIEYISSSNGSLLNGIIFSFNKGNISLYFEYSPFSQNQTKNLHPLTLQYSFITFKYKATSLLISSSGEVL